MKVAASSEDLRRGKRHSRDRMQPLRRTRRNRARSDACHGRTQEQACDRTVQIFSRRQRVREPRGRHCRNSLSLFQRMDARVARWARRRLARILRSLGRSCVHADHQCRRQGFCKSDRSARPNGHRPPARRSLARQDPRTILGRGLRCWFLPKPAICLRPQQL